MGHDSFIKSQVALRKLTLGPHGVQIWSRNPQITPFLGDRGVPVGLPAPLGAWACRGPPHVPKPCERIFDSKLAERSQPYPCEPRYVPTVLPTAGSMDGPLPGYQRNLSPLGVWARGGRHRFPNSKPQTLNPSTRWSTTLSSKVNLPHADKFRA